MKKLHILTGLLACSLLLQHQAKAQSFAAIYKETQSQRTIAALPGGGIPPIPIAYVGSETIFDNSAAGDNAIHIMLYDNNLKLLSCPTIAWGEINEVGVDERNVDIIPITGTVVAQVSYYSPIGSGVVMIRVTLIDASVPNIIGSTLIRSTNPQFNSLIAMDAAYDPTLKRIVICGTAIKGTDASRPMQKEAFVTSIDANTLAFVAMEFYNSNNGIAQTDDDVATRVVMNSTGFYYVTGSENVTKPSGVRNMGIRNMLINPNTLLPTAPGWSVPLCLGTDLAENGVDMAQALAVGNDFLTVVNFAQQNTWGIIRIKAANGNPGGGGALEQSGELNEIAHSISVGNSTKELVVKGMKNRTLTPCQTYDTQADPFMSTLDLTVIPANQTIKNEYLTVIGTMNGGGVDYWNIGGVYAPRIAGSTYPVPVYTNKFADRELPGQQYGTLAPIMDPSLAFLNTKSLQVDLNTKNACPLSQCLLPIHLTFPVQLANTAENNVAVSPVFPTPSPKTSCHDGPLMDCFSGYYKTTGVDELAEGTDVKISPNPATNSFTIALGSSYQNKKTQIVLCDISGKKVATIFDGLNTNDKISYTVPGSVTNGMYFIQIVSDGNGSKTEKIVLDK